MTRNNRFKLSMSPLLMTASAALALSCSSVAAPAEVLDGSSAGNDTGLGTGFGGNEGGISFGDSGSIGIAGAPTFRLPRPAFQAKDPMAIGAWVDPSYIGNPSVFYRGPAVPSSALQIAYPLDGSMHPNNLTKIEIHWRKAIASDVNFRLDVTADADIYHFYFYCNTAACIAQAENGKASDLASWQAEWQQLGHQYAGKSVTLTLNETDGKGGAVLQSKPVTIVFSPEPVLGALYYWAAGTQSIKRATFGSDRAVDFVTPTSTGYECVGCHSVSRDGKTIAFAVAQSGDQNAAAIETALTENPNVPLVAPKLGLSPFRPGAFTSVGDPGPGPKGPQDFLGQTVALSPDGGLAAINGSPVPQPGGQSSPPFFEIRETGTGKTLHKWSQGDALFGPSNLPIMAEWAPDGKSLVVALSSPGARNCSWTYLTCYSSIAVLPYVNGQLGAPRTLVNASDSWYFFYPSWSPDGHWVVFASAPSAALNPDGQANSIQQTQTVLRMVSTSGPAVNCPGAGCIELTKGTQYGPEAVIPPAANGKHSTWPKFAPFSVGEGSDKHIMFVSFSTLIPYGVRTPTLQLWMFGIDTKKTATDPSFAPVWLPYQKVSDQSLAGYWAAIAPCQSDAAGGCKGCVGGEACLVDPSTNSCICATPVIK